MTTKTHRRATDFLAASYILSTGATAVDAFVIASFAYAASTWPDDLEPDGTFGVREHHSFIKRHYITFMRRVLPFLYRHRGWSHYLLTGLIIALAIAIPLRHLSPILAADVFRGILIGHWGHCLEDAATISGAPLFGPFFKKSIHLMPSGYRFNTNGPSDTTFRYALIVLVVVIAGAVVLKNTSSPRPDGRGLDDIVLRSAN